MNEQSKPASASSDNRRLTTNESEEVVTTPKIALGELGWRSVFHDGCPNNSFGSGIVGPDGPRADESSWHTLPDGTEIRAWKCGHCGVRFFAGVDKQYRVTVVPRA